MCVCYPKIDPTLQCTADLKPFLVLLLLTIMCVYECPPIDPTVISAPTNLLDVVIEFRDFPLAAKTSLSLSLMPMPIIILLLIIINVIIINIMLLYSRPFLFELK